MAMIVYGETDEERIRRILLARYEHIDPRDEKIYRDLDARAKARPGEFVLVAWRDWVDDEQGHRIKTKVSFGVLDGSGLKLEGERTVIFPTDKHFCPKEVVLEPMYLIKGGIELSPGGLDVVGHLDQTLEATRPGEERRSGIPQDATEIPILEIVIGDAEVLAWYRKWGDASWMSLLRGMAHGLERRSALHADPEELRREIIDLHHSRLTRQRRIEGLNTCWFTVRDDDGEDVAARDRRVVEGIERDMRACLSKAVAMGMAGEVLVSVDGLCKELGIETK